jgi:hypothetical protein
MDEHYSKFEESEALGLISLEKCKKCKNVQRTRTVIYKKTNYLADTLRLNYETNNPGVPMLFGNGWELFINFHYKCIHLPYENSALIIQETLKSSIAGTYSPYKTIFEISATFEEVGNFQLSPVAEKFWQGEYANRNSQVDYLLLTLPEKDINSYYAEIYLHEYPYLDFPCDWDALESSSNGININLVPTPEISTFEEAEKLYRKILSHLEKKAKDLRK